MKNYETFFDDNDYKRGSSSGYCSAQYIGSLKLLEDYYKSQIYWLGGWNPYSCMSKASRFFSGAWNRKNIDAVSIVIKKHDGAGLREGLHGEHGGDVVSLLTDLRKALLDAGKLVNPKGELAARIDFIQKRCIIRPTIADSIAGKFHQIPIIIDIIELNKEISKSRIVEDQKKGFSVSKKF